jgi:hypothetical protein
VTATGERRAARDGDGPRRRRLRTVAVGTAARARRAVGATAARARLSGGGRRGRGGCGDAWRAVLTATLSPGIGAARGGHEAAVRCRAGPARRASSDRWGPLVSDF